MTVTPLAIMHSRRFRKIIIASIVTLSAAGYLLWKDQKSHPRWTTTRVGNGAVFSMTTGYDSSGKEILLAGGYTTNDQLIVESLVTCQDVKNGNMRWEIHKPVLQDIGKGSANVAISSKGEIFVGWGASSGESGLGGIISKHSSVNGKALWAWNASSESNRIEVPVPVPAANGNVWVAWQSKLSGAENISVATLDGKTGKQLWATLVNVSQEPTERQRVALQTLDNSDALLVASPRLENCYQAWSVQRLSGKTGDIAWQFHIERSNKNKGSYWPPTELHFHVDEENKRLIVNCQPDGKNRDTRFSAYNLLDGKELWTKYLPVDQPLLTQLCENGDLEAWISCSRNDVKISWVKWGKRYGLPWPSKVMTTEYGNRKFVLSGKDGTKTADVYDYSGRDHHSIRLENADVATQEIYSYYSKRMPYNIFSESDWLLLDARRWFHQKSLTDYPNSFRAIRSLSGKQFLSRISWKEYNQNRPHKWEIQAW